MKKVAVSPPKLPIINEILFCAMYLFDRSVILLSLQKCVFIPVRVEELAVKAMSLTIIRRNLTQSAAGGYEKKVARVKQSQTV